MLINICNNSFAVIGENNLINEGRASKGIYNEVQNTSTEEMNNKLELVNIDSAEITKIGEADKHLKYYREDRGYSTYVVCSVVGFYKNNTFYPAYCMNKNLPGAENGDYKVNLKDILNNPKVWRVVSNGYPYKTPEQMGLQNEYDAFAVTKFAIYCVLGESKIDYYSADETDNSGKKMLEVLRRLVEIGNNNTEEMITNCLSIEKIGKVEEDEENYFQEYKVNSTIEMLSYKLKDLTGLSEGSYMSNTNNDYQEEFVNGEHFRIVIPKEKINENINVEISIVGKCKNYPIFYGEAPDGKQNYILTYDSYGEIKTNQILEINIDHLKKGNIKIIKVDGENNDIKIDEVVFELYDENMKLLETLITDENGEVQSDFYRANGRIYYLKEIETKEGYVLDENFLEIKLEADKTIEYKIENKKEEEPERPKEPETPEEPDISEKPQIPIEDNPEEEIVKETYEETIFKEEKLPKTGY